MAFSTGCDSGSVTHLCVSRSQSGSCDAFAANMTFSDDSILSISGSVDLSPLNKVSRFGLSFN